MNVASTIEAAELLLQFDWMNCWYVCQIWLEMRLCEIHIRYEHIDTGPQQQQQHYMHSIRCESCNRSSPSITPTYMHIRFFSCVALWAWVCACAFSANSFFCFFFTNFIPLRRRIFKFKNHCECNMTVAAVLLHGDEWENGWRRLLFPSGKAAEEA